MNIAYMAFAIGGCVVGLICFLGALKHRERGDLWEEHARDLADELAMIKGEAD